jgi:hypothetical protein
MFVLTLLPTVVYFLPYTMISGMSQLGWSIVNSAMMLTLLYLFELQEDMRLRRWTRLAIAVNLSASCIDGALILFWAHAGATMQWLDALSSVCAKLSRAYIFVLAYHGIRRQLHPEIELVATICTLDYLVATTPETIDLGLRFTHWTLGPWLQSWSFNVLGTSITVTQALHTLLLLSLAYAIQVLTIHSGSI